MNLKAMAIGTGLLLVLAVGGVLIDRQSKSPVSDEREGKLLLESIDMAKAALIEINSGDGPITIESKNGTWFVKEQDGFPANGNKIRKFLLKLAGERIEHKVTENQNKLAKLHLLKLDENDNKFDKDKTGISFSIKDKSAQPLFQLLIGGDRRTDRGIMGGYGGQYVRYPEARAAYLIAEPLFIDTMPHDWVRNEIFRFEHKKLMKRFRISVPGVKPYVFSRKDADSKWTLLGGGEENLDEEEVNMLARRIGDLELFKVADPSSSAKELGRLRTGVVDFELFDKRSYRMDIGLKKTDDEFRYIAISAKLDQTADDETLQKEVAVFNSDFAERIVAIYEWEAEQLLKKKEDLFAKKDK
ncbi:MAG: DUF4340 domain-containing protein [SAR324 cluster bacterium]|nr:DUF4340 domain-containing protein [SAR324 cluster bacterium]MCZ6626744.1 DUF4340 domain-containing protein [SAR324 cluster bacterium]